MKNWTQGGRKHDRYALVTAGALSRSSGAGIDSTAAAATAALLVLGVLCFAAGSSATVAPSFVFSHDAGSGMEVFGECGWFGGAGAVGALPRSWLWDRSGLVARRLEDRVYDSLGSLHDGAGSFGGDAVDVRRGWQSERKRCR
jgi:hypothetical protein